MCFRMKASRKQGVKKSVSAKMGFSWEVSAKMMKIFQAEEKGDNVPRMVCAHDRRNIKVCKIVSEYSGTKLKSSLPKIKFGQHSVRGVPLFNPNLMCEEFRKRDESAGVERLMQFNQENHGVKKAVFEIMVSEMKSSGKWCSPEVEIKHLKEL